MTQPPEPAPKKRIKLSTWNWEEVVRRQERTRIYFERMLEAQRRLERAIERAYGKTR